jgi:hypothetical protein
VTDSCIERESGKSQGSSSAVHCGAGYLLSVGSMLRDERSVLDVRFESDHRVSSLVICSRGLNKSSGTVLLVYGTGHR